jgi:ornithine carbamoyltransferase
VHRPSTTGQLPYCDGAPMSKPCVVLDVTDLDADEVVAVLELARREPAKLGRPLDGRGVAMIFEKPSTRTRHSTEIAVVQLGGHPVYTRGEEVGIDTREPAEDVVRILQGYHAVISARVFDHRVLERMAAVADVPVINLLSNRSHPLQAVADALTMEGELGSLDGRRVAWVGDYNNVARSLAEISTMLGATVSLACPPGFGPEDAELERLAHVGRGDISVHHRPVEAVAGADVVHSDTWVSMGQDDEKTQRMQAFAGFTVDDALMASAAPHAVFMHCLPAYRGLEVAASVIDGPRSRVIRQGHNRLHAARAVLAFVVGVRP